MKPVIDLHYFDCRGRAEAFRYFMRDREMDFSDHRIPITDIMAKWPNIKNDRSQTGPFRKLPFLIYDDNEIGESIAIYNFLHRYQNPIERYRSDMIFSATMQDVQGPVGKLVWSDLLPGIDQKRFYQITKKQVFATLDDLERCLQQWQAAPYITGSTPGLADFFLFEGIEIARRAFPKTFAEALPRYEKLALLTETANSNQAVQYERQKHPDAPCTGLANESEVLARLHDFE